MKKNKNVLQKFVSKYLCLTFVVLMYKHIFNMKNKNLSVVVKVRVSPEMAEELQKTAAILAEKEGGERTASEVIRRRIALGATVDGFDLNPLTAEFCDTILRSPIGQKVATSMLYAASFSAAASATAITSTPQN